MDEKRKDQLKKAQAKFKQIKTNLKPELWEKVEHRIKELDTNNSAYLQSLILEDLEKEEPKYYMFYYIAISFLSIISFLLGMLADKLFF